MTHHGSWHCLTCNAKLILPSDDALELKHGCPHCPPKEKPMPEFTFPAVPSCGAPPISSTKIICRDCGAGYAIGENHVCNVRRDSIIADLVAKVGRLENQVSNLNGRLTPEVKAAPLTCVVCGMQSTFGRHYNTRWVCDKCAGDIAAGKKT